MTIEEIKKNAPDGATHYWSNDYGCAYYCYCEKINRWLYYDRHHDYWFSQRESLVGKLKPLN